MRLTDAHDLSHVVKDRLMARYPQIADAIIHIEPPPQKKFEGLLRIADLESWAFLAGDEQPIVLRSNRRIYPLFARFRARACR